MKNIPEMTAEIERLEKLLDKVRADGTAESEIREAAETVFAQCREIRPDSGMMFFVLDDPTAMPGDARVDFLYRPTYLAAAILLCAVERCPGLLDEKHRSALAGVLTACTGRDFHGHGYEAESGLVDAMEILLKAPVKRFLANHPDFCTEFAHGFNAAIEELRGICGGDVRPAFGSDDGFVRRAKDVFSVWENS